MLVRPANIVREFGLASGVSCTKLAGGNGLYCRNKGFGLGGFAAEEFGVSSRLNIDVLRLEAGANRLWHTVFQDEPRIIFSGSRKED